MEKFKHFKKWYKMIFKTFYNAAHFGWLVSAM